MVYHSIDGGFELGSVSFPQRWRTACNALYCPLLYGISDSNDVDDYLFANPRVARAFVDYMATQGVILTIQQHNQSDVWLADESGRTRAGGAGAFSRKPGRSITLSRRQLAVRSYRQWPALHHARYPFFAALRERAGPVTSGDDDRLRGGVYRHANSRRSGSDVMAGRPFDPTLKFEFWRYFTRALALLADAYPL